MKLLRNYILKDFLSSFIFSLFSITLVMVLGNLIKISDMVIRKGVSLPNAIKLFSFLMLYLLGFTIPLSLLLGLLLSLGRLISDNEFIAVQTAGISIIKILNIFLVLGTIFSLGLFILNDKVIPEFHFKYRSQMKNLYAENMSAIIEPGVFMEKFKNYILYAGEAQNNTLKNVFIYETSRGKLKQITFAKQGEFIVDDSTLRIKLEDGFRDEINTENRKDFYRLKFKVFFYDFPIEGGDKTEIDKKPKDLTMQELRDKSRRLKSLDIVPTEIKQEIHKRISFSLSPLVFIVLGFGVSTIIRHREKSINFGIAFILAGAYYILFLMGETVVETKIIPPFLGMWMPNLLFTGMGLYLIRKNVYVR